MKNHIIFKFIAILLCAASLMGAIGSAAGILALTEFDLYNKTVTQVKEEQLQKYTQRYADSLGLMYASTELGGSPEAMVQDLAAYRGLEQAYSTFGYTIQDPDGTVLSAYNPELAEDSKISAFTIPVTGQYMHLVSLESESESAARATDAQIAAYRQDIGVDENSTVPAEGISIEHVMFLGTSGALIYEAEGRHSGTSESTYYYEDGGIRSNGHDGNDTGYLFYNQNGELVYNSFFEDYDVTFPETEISEYVFINSSKGFVLQNSDPDGLGVISNESGNLRFVSYFTLSPAAVETEPETLPPVTEETVPVTTAPEIEETVPVTEETVILDENGNPVETEAPAEETTPAEETEAMEETAPAETAEETVPSSASAVPEETADAEAVSVDTGVPAEEEAPVENADGSTEPIPVETMPPETLPAETIPVEALPEETLPEETVPEETQPVLINGKPLSDYQINSHHYYDPDRKEWMTAKFVYVPMPELEVTVYVDQTTLQDAAMYDLLAMIRSVRNYLVPAIGVCLLVFAVFAVYLCTAAGRKPKTDVVMAGGLNRLSLDLYLCGGSFLIALIIAYLPYGIEYLIKQDFLVGCGFAAAAVFAACLIFVSFCFAFVAQIKTPGGFWWRNSLCGICIRAFMHFAMWLENFLATKGLPALGRMFKKLWDLIVKGVVWAFHLWEKFSAWLVAALSRVFHWIGDKLRRFFAMIPLTWQWIVCGMVLFIVIFIAANSRIGFLILICLMSAFALIFYGAHCFGTLLDSTKKMAKGDLNFKVDDKLMVGSFEEFAADLNDLANVAVVAAQKQLKSERMKTELITNVSHDIKTPLTSIINYVDLLQKPHTEEEEAQYLEVLDRQSQRLKKLIDDLMDMSKASTGNMAVDIETVDAVESVNQALGEFADKLDRAHLIPVFRHDDPQVPMKADGRLVWRVLSNLLSNAVKYAMPGTRLYIDLMTLEGKVVLSLKNISRDELNIDAEELMERFVRGDDSRNTEGSGLGLNIAKSLMELQKGQLQLLVDGDLFKVTLIFPGA